MPQFVSASSVLNLVQVWPGSTIVVFDSVADVLTPPATSRVLCPTDAGGVERGAITFDAFWATTPTASLVIYGSNTPPTSAGPQNGIVLGTLTANGTFTDTGAHAYYWAYLASQTAGGALSLTAHVR